MHTIRLSWVVFILACCVFVCAPQRPRASQGQADTEQPALADFNRRVQAYATLHRTLEGPVPTPSVSSDPAEIRRAMDALAAQLVRARLFAKMGDVFTPQVAPIVRNLVRRSFAGSGRELLAIVQEEEAEGTPPVPRINTRWPEGAGFSLVPPKILAALPRLPDELQYRFRGRHLVLWDMHADLIVDVLPNVIQRVTIP